MLKYLGIGYPKIDFKIYSANNSGYLRSHVTLAEDSLQDRMGFIYYELCLWSYVLQKTKSLISTLQGIELRLFLGQDIPPTLTLCDIVAIGTILTSLVMTQCDA